MEATIKLTTSAAEIVRQLDPIREVVCGIAVPLFTDMGCSIKIARHIFSVKHVGNVDIELAKLLVQSKYDSVGALAATIVKDGGLQRGDLDVEIQNKDWTTQENSPDEEFRI